MTLNLLIHEQVYDRLADRMRTIAPAARFSVMNAQGQISVDGQIVPIESVTAEVGWSSLDVLKSPARREYFRALLKLDTIRWVQSATAGVDDPVFARLVTKGITLTNSDAQAPAIADFILGAALDFFQRQEERRELQAAQTWAPMSFRELSDTTWLIVGYGHIGRETARRVAAFGAKVTGIRRQPQADEFAHQIVAMDQLEAQLPLADVVVLSIALNEATQHLANTAFFKRMKSGSLLINIGRGKLVDEDALLVALDANAPARAVLDVFDTEPLPPDHSLWTNPRVRVSAHTSNAGSGNARRGDELFLDNLARYVAGETLRNVVKPQDLG